MADLVTSLIKHLRADATLLALVGGVAARIDKDIAAGVVLPAIGIIEEEPEPISRSAADVRVLFIAKDDTGTRSDLVAIRARLQALFHDHWHETISSGADAILVVRSKQVPGEGIGKDEEDGAWLLKDVYQFLIAT